MERRNTANQTFACDQSFGLFLNPLLSSGAVGQAFVIAVVLAAG
jgi:hypothetical protein